MPKGGNSRGGGRGVLGLQSNPERQILPFGPYAYNYPSDDSSDSDFNPHEGTSQQEISGDESGTDDALKLKIASGENDSKTPKKKATPKKRKVSTGSTETPSKKRRKKRTSQADNKNNTQGEEDADKHGDFDVTTFWSQMMPDEILLKIFSYAVNDGGAIPLLFRVSRVCHKWHRVSSEPSLWTFVDLSSYCKEGKDSILESLVKTRLSKRLEQIHLDDWKELTIVGIRALITGCPYLESISLSGCDKIYLDAVRMIVEKCHNLKSIDLSFIKNDAAGNGSILNLLMYTGHQLTELHLRKCTMISNTTLSAVQGVCRRMLELDLSGTNVSSLNIEKLQAGCPKLRKLHLSSLTIRVTSASRKIKDASQGFPYLEFLSISSFGGGVGLDDDFLLRLLKTSSNLKVLDMRGCTKITRKGLDEIPCMSLVKLYISRSMPFLGTIDAIVTKWGSSLKVLEMARNSFPFNLADLAMNYIAKAESLEILNLESTTVSSKGVRMVLNGCRKLKELNLTACRGMPRGVKRLHDEQGINELRNNMDDWSVINVDS